jgi:polyketide synthase PksN
MEERIGFMAGSIDEVLNKLCKYVEGDQLLGEDLYSNHTDDKCRSLIQKWMKKEEVDWNKLYSDHQMKKISLPTYPFAKESYWIPESEDTNKEERESNLHPFVHMNISTLREQKFISRFSGKEIFLSDYVVNGKKMLPKVAYIEIACKAGEIAGEMKVKKVKNVMWHLPIEVQEKNLKKEVYVYLYPNEENVHYEVCTQQKKEDKILHSEGEIIYKSDIENEIEEQFIDLQEIKQRCTNTVDYNTCYKYFRNIRVEYGYAFQGIKDLHYNKTESLAYLELPSVLVKDFEQFVLHPSLMEGALQTLVGLNGMNTEERNLYLPVAVGEVEIIHPLAKQCFSYVTKSGQDSFVKKFNICIIDHTGKVLVKIKDLSMKKVENEVIDFKYSNQKVYECDYEKKLIEVLNRVKNKEISAKKGNELLEGIYE